MKEFTKVDDINPFVFILLTKNLLSRQSDLSKRHFVGAYASYISILICTYF